MQKGDYAIQKLVYSIADNAVCLTAAHFHDLKLTWELAYLANEAFYDLGVLKLRLTEGH